MIDWGRVHHHGVTVADIALSQAVVGEAFGLTWAPVRVFDPLPFWTPAAGTHEIVVHATYSRGGGHRVELVQGTGPFFDPARRPDARHIGVWADDLPAEAARLIAQGWAVVSAGTAPEDGYGVIAYLAHPASNLMVELISTVLEGDLAGWIGD